MRPAVFQRSGLRVCFECDWAWRHRFVELCVNTRVGTDAWFLQCCGRRVRAAVRPIPRNKSDMCLGHVKEVLLGVGPVLVEVLLWAVRVTRHARHFVIIVGVTTHRLQTVPQHRPRSLAALAALAAGVTAASSSCPVKQRVPLSPPPVSA